MVNIDESGKLNLNPENMTSDEAKIRFDLACIDYIRQPNKEAFDFISHNGHDISILDFVQLLEPHITSKDDNTRLNGISLLIDVSLASEMKDPETNVLVQFLCGRLAEKYNIIPKILSGLIEFVKRKELENEIVVKIIREFFKKVDVQAFHHETRLKSYTLLHTILHKHLLGILETMNEEFVISYVNTVDGEQDPRNLLLIFKMNVIVLQHFNIDNMEEVLFDVISCYYPIDFAAPDDSSVSITPNDLTSNLNSCLKANNKLAPHVIPFLLEKFSSSLMQTKLQSCDTLKLCVVSYGIAAMEKFMMLIWNEMKREIFGGMYKYLRSKCLDVVSSIFWVLTLPNLKSKDIDPVEFIKVVFDFCTEKMEYSETKYLKPTIDVLVAIIKSSGMGCGLVSEFCFLELIKRFETHSVDTVKELLLQELVNILVEMQCEPTRANAAVVHFNWQNFQRLFLEVIKADNHTEMSRTGIYGLSELLNIYHLTEKHKEDNPQLDIKEIVSGVYSYIGAQTDLKDETEGLEMLTVISREYPDIVNTLLLNNLLDRVDKGDSTARSMLSRLLIGPLLIQHSSRLMSRFVQHQDMEIISLFTTAISYQDSVEVIKFCQDYLFYQIFHLLIQSTIISDESSELNSEHAVILFQDFTVILLKKSPTRTLDMQVFMENFTQSAVFKPLEKNAPVSQTRLTAIFNAALMYGSMDCTFDPMMTKLDMGDCLRVACESSDPLTIRSLTSAVGVMLNRLDEGMHLEQLIDQVFEALDSCTMINNKVWLCIRTCQSLICRCHETGGERSIKQYVKYLTDELTHVHIANLTNHILEPVYQGRRKVLYKQKFLISLIPLINPYVTDSKLLSKEVFSSLVRSLGALLLNLPQSLISTHGDTLYPIVLNGLVPTQCQTGTLKLVQYLITNVASIVTMNLDTLIWRLCDIATCPQSTVHCRVEALTTLQTCTAQLHRTHTHVHRQAVTKMVTKALSDRKRVVRQCAVQTLQSWSRL